MDLGRYGLREILDAAFIDYATNKPFMYMDYANAATNEWTADVTYATGGSGAPRRISFFGNKQSTLTFETQIFSMKHLAMIAGRDIESATQNIFKREVLTVKDVSGTKTITLEKTPLNLTSLTVLKFENGVATEEVTATTINTKDVELSGTNVNVGDEVEVFYQCTTATEAHKLSFTAKDFPRYVKIIGNTQFADEVAGELVSAQLIYYKARLQPNFTLNLSPTGDPTSISMVFDIFPQKVNGVDTLADLIIYND
ncbi:hypothetical protein EDM57_05200 [Brevibacillus gelatini]|uniref:Uncharacterized protein n=1 Tax=Brevibacillus gelatini TaxID=1655277 RepID=A0A3M8B854_9BACL|nr:hypothetical protein [Brevibacillus gelatini]RNB59540.1 hypothetical protein EDM57_05200 [Brevibacillus gelatini]